MNRSNAIALGLSALVTGAVATSAQQPIPGPPIPPPEARPGTITRSGAEVRQMPALGAPVIGRLSRGDRVTIDPIETSFPGFIAIVREWLTDTNVRIIRHLGWLATSDVVIDPQPVAARDPRVPTTLAPPRVVIGTIGGHHSLAETRDLLAVADYRFEEVEKALRENRFRPTDAAASAAVEADWAKLSAAWDVARKEIARNLTLKLFAVPFVDPFVYGPEYIPTEDEWVRTLSFVEGQELVRGSLQDITLRLERLLGRKILFEGQPGQNAPDVDIELFQDLDAGIKEGEAMASRAKEAVKRAVTSPTGLAIGSTLLAAGGLLLAVTFLPEIRLGLSALRGRR